MKTRIRNKPGRLNASKLTSMELHLDTGEANAAGVSSGDCAKIVTNGSPADVCVVG